MMSGGSRVSCRTGRLEGECRRQSLWNGRLGTLQVRQRYRNRRLLLWRMLGPKIEAGTLWRGRGGANVSVCKAGAGQSVVKILLEASWRNVEVFYGNFQIKLWQRYVVISRGRFIEYFIFRLISVWQNSLDRDPHHPLPNKECKAFRRSSPPNNLLAHFCTRGNTRNRSFTPPAATGSYNFTPSQCYFVIWAATRFGPELLMSQALTFRAKQIAFRCYR